LCSYLLVGQLERARSAPTMQDLRRYLRQQEERLAARR
jgi:hypothetical protein